jgi:hypothetical protein
LRLAAGARIRDGRFQGEVANRNIENVEISQAGCNGYCAHDPTFEIIMPGMPTVIYGHVDDKNRPQDRRPSPGQSKDLSNECVLITAVDIISKGADMAYKKLRIGLQRREMPETAAPMRIFRP